MVMAGKSPAQEAVTGDSGLIKIDIYDLYKNILT